MSDSEATVIGLIPARYESSRFPKKLLTPILGKSLLQRTYENAKKCKKLQKLVVATDHEEIYDHVLSFGGNVLMTSPDCATGTDRLADALERDPTLEAAAVIVNIQGDEPCLEPYVIEQVAQKLLERPQAMMSTAITQIQSEEEACNPSVVKCVINQHHEALYFSRTLIPYRGTLQAHNHYYHHLGIYGYRPDFLRKYAALPPTPLQLAENLEQLKVLEHGFKICVAIVDQKSVGVDTVEDIQKVKQFLLCQQSTSSSQEESAPLSERD